LPGFEAEPHKPSIFITPEHKPENQSETLPAFEAYDNNLITLPETQNSQDEGFTAIPIELLNDGNLLLNKKINLNNSTNIVISDQRKKHILYGDKTGGGHMSPGLPGKSAFPENWNENKILEAARNISKDTSLSMKIQANGRIVKEGVYDGVRIKVVLESKEDSYEIITTYPIKKRIK